MGKIHVLLRLRIGAELRAIKLRAIVGRARRCGGLEIAKWGSNSLDRRGSESHAAWKGSSSILLRMLDIGEINILKQGSHSVTIGVSGVPLLVKHRIRRPLLGGSEVNVQRVGRRVGITSLIRVDDVIVVVDEKLIIRRGRRDGALSC